MVPDSYYTNVTWDQTSITPTISLPTENSVGTRYEIQAVANDPNNFSNQSLWIRSAPFKFSDPTPLFDQLDFRKTPYFPHESTCTATSTSSMTPGPWRLPRSHPAILRRRATSWPCRAHPSPCSLSNVNTSNLQTLTANATDFFGNTFTSDNIPLPLTPIATVTPNVTININSAAPANASYTLFLEETTIQQQMGPYTNSQLVGFTTAAIPNQPTGVL